MDGLIGLLFEDDSLQHFTVEALARLGRHCTSFGNLELEIMRKCCGEVVQKQNLTLCRGHINLIGQMVCSNTCLLSHISASFLDFIIFGLNSADELCQADIIFVLVTVYKHQQTVSHISLRASASLCHHVCLSICSTRVFELQVNLLGLIQVLLETKEFIDILLKLCLSACNETLLRGFRRMLACDYDILRIGAIQCCIKLLSADSQFAEKLLQSDISEFLSELLKTTNESVLRCALQCLYLIADHQLYYSGCHSIYGIEAIITVLTVTSKSNNSTRLSCCGLQLLERLLSRQPASLQLFNSMTLSFKCMDAITSFLSSKDETVQTLAWTTLASFLRQQHIPHVVDMYGNISKALAVCRECTGDDIAAVVPSSEELLGAILESMDKACQLGTLDISTVISQTTDTFNPCSVNSIPDNSLVENERANLVQQHFRQQLVELCDSSCIPYAMMLMRDIEGHEDFHEIFYRLLMKLVTLDEEIGEALAIKWADVGILRFAVNAKVKLSTAVRKSSTLCIAVDDLLSEMCYRLLRQMRLGCSDETEHVRLVLTDSLPRITGTISECLSLLYQNYSPCSTTSCHQTALLALLTVSAMCNHRLVSAVLLLSALSSFVEVVGDICLLPNLVSKFVTYLFADSMTQLCGSKIQTNYRNVEELLCRSLQRSKDSNTDTVHLTFLHPTVLQWIMMSSLRSSKYGMKMLLRFLSMYEDVNTCLDDIGIDKETCVACLTENALTEDCVDVTYTFQLVKSLHGIVMSDIPAFNSAKDILERTSFRCIHLLVGKLLSNHRLSPLPDATVEAVLILLTRQAMSEAQVSFAGEATELKYICQVMSVLERSLSRDTPAHDVLLAALNYLHVATSKSTKCNHQVLSVLLSNADFVQSLQYLLNTTVVRAKCVAAALYLTGRLVESAHDFNIPCQNRLHLVADYLLFLADPQTGSITASGALFLWSAMLKYELFVQLAYNKDALRDAETSMLNVRENVLRRLVILLQNHVLQGDTLAANSAVRCFGELLTYTHRYSPMITLKLIKQPWNILCVKSCLLHSSVYSLIKYSDAHPRHHHWPYYEVVSTLTDCFIHFPSLECTKSQLLWAFIQLLQQIIEKGITSTDHMAREKCAIVVNLLQHIRKSLNVSTAQKQCCPQSEFIFIDGVLVDDQVCSDASSSAICLQHDTSILQTVIEGLLK
ncbi:meiosis inhibitor protein 1-like isoform X2 [Corticium candelabrum]|uniref:meiosis inhibitor protein 1-like isoform X2 n=1 Tax=Corticium candelabrum TaxID=121492 RepID=UPI002E37EEB0|nr:meiosis inhibitor protein 1-like isoform X2 [Corticium candelabrum]